MLPQEFTDRMEKMLGGEYSEFLASYRNERFQALRLNRMKAGREEFIKQSPFHLTPVPWAADGFYYEAGDMPGRHPYHEAGVYYIQEPSAMAPAACLGARPGERILDLCAAPGGKSTQIAADMAGRGLLVCNEIHPARARILSENVERMGIRNAVVTNETPERLAAFFPSYFDRILVDAPCSGEGMFRKNPEAVREWSPDNVRLCAQRQDSIMESAVQMLRPGGSLVYSTCTFAPEEDEGTVGRFIELHPECYPEELPEGLRFQPGRGEWSGQTDERLGKTARLWPHKLRGEGHFMAMLVKKGERGEPNFPENRADGIVMEEKRRERSRKKDVSECDVLFSDFCQSYLNTELTGRLLRFGEQLYLTPEGLPSLKGLKVLRPGLHLGTTVKNRFQPSHALALALRPSEAVLRRDMASSGREPYAYLNGETLPSEGEKGWYLMSVDGYSIGWGKLAGNVMKNHYPKGLRKAL